eukprot:TRINITY_DN25876_c0_g1_i1.p1 TRINITY_DN25876_c0_g1~~TRINITY_DN25876_c0_g1_i1.p1  ORF type:complete len:234 (+),score=28.30 TRINITY_DN25876_c0_g1_i1:92-703(+)
MAFFLYLLVSSLVAVCGEQQCDKTSLLTTVAGQSRRSNQSQAWKHEIVFYVENHLAVPIHDVVAYHERMADPYGRSDEIRQDVLLPGSRTDSMKANSSGMLVLEDHDHWHLKLTVRTSRGDKRIKIASYTPGAVHGNCGTKSCNMRMKDTMAVLKVKQETDGTVYTSIDMDHSADCRAKMCDLDLCQAYDHCYFVSDLQEEDE